MPRTDVCDYYVSIVRGRRRGLLAGPFATHTEALANVDRARIKACEIDQWAWFDLFGTCSLPRSAANPSGTLNALLGIVARVQFKPGDKVSTGHTLRRRLTKSPHPSCLVNDTDHRAWEYQGGGWDYEKTFA